MTMFVVWEGRAPAPMLSPALFASRSFSAADATAFMMTAAIMAAAFLIAQYFHLVQGNPPLSAGLRLLPWTATPMLIAPAAGILSDRIESRPIMAGGLALQALGLGWFARAGTTTVGYGALVIPLVIAGIGISMGIPTTPAAALTAVAPEDLGKASGTNNTLRRFGGVFGIAVATAVFSAHGHLGSVASFDAGFRPALAVAACLSLLGALTALGVTARRRARLPGGVEAAPVPIASA